MTVRVSTTGGEEFDVEQDEIVLSAAMRQGVDIPYSCRSGNCRTCLSKVISGRIEHEPDYEDELMLDRTEIEDGFRLLCSSMAFEDSVIDPGW